MPQVAQILAIFSLPLLFFRVLIPYCEEAPSRPISLGVQGPSSLNITLCFSMFLTNYRKMRMNEKTFFLYSSCYENTRQDTQQIQLHQDSGEMNSFVMQFYKIFEKVQCLKKTVLYDWNCVPLWPLCNMNIKLKFCWKFISRRYVQSINNERFSTLILYNQVNNLMVLTTINLKS